MLFKLFDQIISRPLRIHAGAAIASFAGFQWVKARLDASYAASGHPVDYATGQTSFNAQTIKGYYAHMQDAGTLDVYWATQVIDYGFIVAMGSMAMFVCTLVARGGRAASWARRIGMWSAASVLLGALCDAIENGWSFVMLSDPQGFAAWLAPVYSGFASAKFALIALGMALLLMSLGLSTAGRVLKRPGLG